MLANSKASSSQPIATLLKTCKKKKDYFNIKTNADAA